LEAADAHRSAPRAGKYRAALTRYATTY
jgi:hypothetical protein